jgi:hypothetical protein
MRGVSEMRIGALSIHTATIALAAISFASTAGAGLVLCGDVTDHALLQTLRRQWF